MELKIHFKPGFAFLFEGGGALGHWDRVVAGTVKWSDGDVFGPHDLCLFLQSAESYAVQDTTGLSMLGDVAWDLRGCRATITGGPNDHAAGVTAPRNSAAKSPSTPVEWENWKWSLDILATHAQMGDALQLKTNPEVELDGAIVLDRGRLCPLPGFKEVEFVKAASAPGVSQPYANTATFTHQWAGNTLTVELEKGGQAAGHIVFTHESNGPLELLLYVKESKHQATGTVTDIAMLYKLVQTKAVVTPLTSGKIKHSFTARGPGRECASGAFYLP